MKYKVRFAGSTLEVEYLRKEKLNDDSDVYIFTDNKYIYPIKKENILCGNFKP
jgi:DNA-binding MltR family transcriptional regulator